MSEQTLSRIDISHDQAKQRYEVSVDGRLAGFLTYRLVGSEVRFLHTAVDEAYRGQGLAHQLVGYAVADVEAQHGTPVGVCPFVAGFLARDPAAAPRG